MEEKTRSSEHELLSQHDVRSIARLLSDSQKGKKLIGEVRVKVKLTNAGDEVLVRRGLLTVDKIRSYEANALVDTGAVKTEPGAIATGPRSNLTVDQTSSCV